MLIVFTEMAFGEHEKRHTQKQKQYRRYVYLFLFVDVHYLNSF